MAQLCLLTSSLLVGMAVYLALGGAPEARDLDARRMGLRMTRGASWLLARVSCLGLTRRLAELPCVAHACDVLQVRANRGRSDGEEGRYLGSREDACAALLLLWAGAVMVLSLVFATPLAAVIAFGAPFVALPIWDGAERRRQQQDLVAEMPGVFRTLSLAMGAGETLAQAVDYVGTHERGQAGTAFLRASMRLRCGLPAEEALADLAEELDAPGVGLLVTALLISQRTGSPLRELFQNSAALVEREGEFERLLAVKTAQVRLSVRIVCLLPLVMISGLSLLSPDFRQGLSTLPGMVSVAAAALMDGAALMIIRSLMKGVL